MDRLVKPDVKEVEISFNKGQKSTTTFRVTNLMHAMSVAVSLTTTDPSVFSFSQPFSIIPPLSSSSYTLILCQSSSDQQPLPLSIPPDAITIKSALLPTGKAHQDELRRLFSRHGSHIFRDAVIPISLVGPQVAEFLISNPTQIPQPQVSAFFNKAIIGCTGTQLTALLKSAVIYGCTNLVTTLIDYGVDVKSVDCDQRSMISLAVKSGNLDVLKILVDSGCEINDSVDKVLHDAAAQNRKDLMEVACTNFRKIDLNSVNSTGKTPIHVAAKCGYVEVIKFCVSQGGKVDVLDCNGSTPLHLAAEKGHLGAAEYLLDCSDYIKYIVNKEGKTAFAVAVDNGHSDLYDLLHLGDMLHRAARLDDVSVIKSCLAQGATVNGRDQNGWTPLHRAAFKGQIGSVKVLLDHGAKVDLMDDAGYTPLHCAMEAGHEQVALLLIAHGAKANLKSLKVNLDCFKNRNEESNLLNCI